jgi:hypothetical protein
LLLLMDGALFAAILWADPFGGMAMLAMVAIAVPISWLIRHLKRRERFATA